MTPESNLNWWNHHCNWTDRKGMELLDASTCLCCSESCGSAMKDMVLNAKITDKELGTRLLLDEDSCYKKYLHKRMRDKHKNRAALSIRLVDYTDDALF